MSTKIVAPEYEKSWAVIEAGVGDWIRTEIQKLKLVGGPEEQEELALWASESTSAPTGSSPTPRAGRWESPAPRRVSTMRAARSPNTRLLVHQTYHSSLTTILQAVQDRWLRESSAESFAELRDELRAFRAELTGLLELQVREPDRDRHRLAKAAR